MDFQNYTIQRFKVGIDFHLRVYQVEERNGLVYFRNVLTGKYLFPAMDTTEITIAGEPYNKVRLQEIVFNKSCTCEGETDDSEHKIFDLSFDKTFE